MKMTNDNSSISLHAEEQSSPPLRLHVPVHLAHVQSPVGVPQTHLWISRNVNLSAKFESWECRFTITMSLPLRPQFPLARHHRLSMWHSHSPLSMSSPEHLKCGQRPQLLSSTLNMYRASHVLVDWVMWTWISSVPLSARLCLG